MKTFLVLTIVLGALVSVSAAASCGIDACAGDEFCNSSLSACQCDSTAYRYIGSNSTPTVTCNEGILNIFLPKCWLEENGFNVSTVRLKRFDCLAAKEIVDNTAQMTFHTPLAINYCNTTAEVNATQVTYMNTLYGFSETSVNPIQRILVMNVSCTVPMSAAAQLRITMKPALRIIPIDISGPNNSVAYMRIYKDEAFTTLLSDNDTLYMNDNVYISVVMPELDANNFKLKVVRIYVSPGESKNLQYDLLVNGCPAGGLLADLLTIISNGVYTESRFVMKFFHISGYDSIVLSADVLLCVDNCVPVCTEGNPPTVSSNTTCENETCASDEYCDSSGTACQCNSTIYPYAGNGPAPTIQCSRGILNIFVSKCWLERNNYNTSSIRLENPDCSATREIVNDTAQMDFHRSLMASDCNTIVEINGTHATYWNTLYIFANNVLIQTREDYAKRVSCTFPLYRTYDMVTLRPIAGTVPVSVPERIGNLLVNMTIYEDDFSIWFPEAEKLYVEETINISVVSPNLDANTFKLKVLRIFASPGGSMAPTYDLLVDGCPVTPALLSVISNGVSNECQFTMKAFQMYGSENVSLYVEVEFCSADCITNCSSEIEIPVTANASSLTSCGVDTCTGIEFCNVDTCQCNATFYKYTDNYPSPVVDCSRGILSILASKCWLEKNGYNTSSIRLRNPDCLAAREIVNGTPQMTFHQLLTVNECNTTAEMNETNVTYMNTLYIPAETIPVRTRNDFAVNVSCSYPLRMSVQLLITLKPETRVTSVALPGMNASFVVYMTIYTDNTFSIPLSDNSTLNIEDTVYISVVMPDLDMNIFKLKVVRIYVSAGESENVQYDLLLNGCPAGGLLADLLTVIANGISIESRFAMKVFHISGSDSIRLSADVVLCVQNCASDCTPPTVSPNTTSVSCANETCASDEYCDSSGTACQCDSTIYPYAESHPAPSVDCGGGKLDVFISKCLLERNGYNTSGIRLQSSTCLAGREIVNGAAQMTFHRPLMNNDCDDIVELNSTHVTYWNTLYIFAITTPLQTREDLAVNVSCSYPLRLNVPPYTTLNPILGSALIGLSGTGVYYTVHMAAYSDVEFLTLLPENEPIYLDGTVYILVALPYLDGNIFKTKVVRMYISSGESDSPQYLLMDGCPTDNLTTDIVTVISNGISNESRFIIKGLNFTNLIGLRLSADVEMCTENCTLDCSSQTNSTGLQGNAATVSVLLPTKLGICVMGEFYTFALIRTTFISFWFPRCLVHQLNKKTKAKDKIMEPLTPE